MTGAKTGPWLEESLAANGRPICANFADWFGGSKVVVDKGGLLEVVFHVANGDFDAFDRSKIGSDYGDVYKLKGIAPLGFYFSNKVQGLGSTPGVIDVAPGRAGASPVVLPVYLSLQNPLVIETSYDATSHIDIFSQTIKRLMREQKHDGVVVRGINDSAVFVASKPAQIKSATGNSGLYLKRSGSMTDSKEALELERANRARSELGLMSKKMRLA